jgi:H+/Cl- antiporter ClcA
MDENSLEKYHLKNTNLLDSEKVVIESLYQVPQAINEFLFIVILLIIGINDWLIAYVVAGVIGIMLSIYSEKTMHTKNYALFMKLSVIFAGYGSMLIDFILAIVAYMLTKNYLIALIPVLGAFGMLSFLTPAMHTTIILNRGDKNQRKKRLHFKYVMANKIWGIKL